MLILKSLIQIIAKNRLYFSNIFIFQVSIRICKVCVANGIIINTCNSFGLWMCSCVSREGYFFLNIYYVSTRIYKTCVMMVINNSFGLWRRDGSFICVINISLFCTLSAHIFYNKSTQVWSKMQMARSHQFENRCSVDLK